MNLCLVMTERVVDPSNELGYSLFNRYDCAGEKSITLAFETWSSSKIFAMANAASHLRSNESLCGSGNVEN